MDVKKMISDVVTQAINRILLESDGLQKQLLPLIDKVICIHIIGFPSSFYFIFEENRLNFLLAENAVSDLTLSGTPSAFIQQLLELNSGQLSKKINIEGDVALAQSLQQVLLRLDIDWEEILSKYVGDIFAHQLGLSIRKTTQFGQRQIRSLNENLREFLQEEMRFTPTRVEVEYYIHSIDIMRQQIDRLSAKISLLEKSTRNSLH